MKKMMYRTGFKITSIILMLIIIATSALSILCVIGIYNNLDPMVSKIEIKTDIMRELMNKDARTIFSAMTRDENGYKWENSYSEKYYTDLFYKENTNVRIQVTDNSGNIVFSNCDTYDTEKMFTEGHYYHNIKIGVLSDFAADDIYSFVNDAVDTVVDMRVFLVVYSVISIILVLVIWIMLLVSAGHKYNCEGIQINIIDKVPTDILIAAYVFIFFTLLAIESNLYDTLLHVTFLLAFAVFFVLSFISCTMGIAVRIKAHTLIKNTLIYRIVKFIYKCLKRFFSVVFELIKSIPQNWKVAVVLAVFAVFDIIFPFLGVVYVFYWIAKIIICFYYAVCLRKLEKASTEISNGNISYKVDVSRMPWTLKKHGENLNNINKGLSNAVSEQLKSERMRTELITNVSHDIKTPLTSIINYADILKREGLSSENANEYLNVILRQSVRLKKLTEDIIEASKAATGNMNINLEPTDVGILITQALVEYDDKLRSKELTVVSDVPDSNLSVIADGRYLWRIIDNLLGNIYKYSMPGTRVYVKAFDNGDSTAVVFRNISQNSLNMNGDELFERFVRGDKSRNTEGSGLGLSIAKSLAELQKGNLTIEIDGDLFKVTLTLVSDRSDNSK